MQVAIDALMSTLKTSSKLVLMSRADPNPRVIYEGLACNLPFAVSTNVVLPREIMVIHTFSRSMPLFVSFSLFSSWLKIDCLLSQGPAQAMTLFAES